MDDISREWSGVAVNTDEIKKKFSEGEQEQGQDQLLSSLPELGAEQVQALHRQQQRLVPAHQAQRAARDARRHWDIFYKRNGDRFFKTRHWILREFPELRFVLGGLLEAGCGTGALLFPLSEELSALSPLFACDLSPRAIDLVKSHPQYCEPRFRAFQMDLCDSTQKETLAQEVGSEGVGAVTAVFLLSALPPQLQACCLQALVSVLRPGGVFLLRDYARYDIAQIRFGPGHKIEENLYLRQDGTMSYFFTIEEIRELFTSVGLVEKRIGYVERRTTNVKEGLDVPRLFVQACFQKPPVSDLLPS